MAIHVYRSGVPGDGAEGQYAVWSECEPGHYHSGRCIGLGSTLSEAVTNARVELQADIDALGEITEASAVSELDAEVTE